MELSSLLLSFTLSADQPRTPPATAAAVTNNPSGIPEAAPKVKRQQREEVDEASEEELRQVSINSSSSSTAQCSRDLNSKHAAVVG